MTSGRLGRVLERLQHRLHLIGGRTQFAAEAAAAELDRGDGGHAVSEADHAGGWFLDCAGDRECGSAG